MNYTETAQKIGTLKWYKDNDWYVSMLSLERFRPTEENDTKGKELGRANVEVELMHLLGAEPGEYLLRSILYIARHLLLALHTKNSVSESMFLCFVMRTLNNDVKMECRAYKEKA